MLRETARKIAFHILYVFEVPICSLSAGSCVFHPAAVLVDLQSKGTIRLSKPPQE